MNAVLHWSSIACTVFLYMLGFGAQERHSRQVVFHCIIVILIIIIIIILIKTLYHDTSLTI